MSERRKQKCVRCVSELSGQIGAQRVDKWIVSFIMYTCREFPRPWETRDGGAWRLPRKLVAHIGELPNRECGGRVLEDDALDFLVKGG